MAKPFLSENFLLSTPTSEKLYFEFAQPLPLFDYHCHISPAEIAGNKRFDNLTQIWLAGDHYKWRAMRANGVPERFITGDASDYEKFLAYARTVPALPTRVYPAFRPDKVFAIDQGDAFRTWVERLENLSG